MNFPSEKEVAELRQMYPAGTRIQLIHMDDINPVPDGSIGIVTGIDDAGSIHMKWDCGRSLAIVPEVDAFKKI